jgi:hypothetical protein
VSAVDVETPAAAERPRHYGFSVLLTGFARVWRAPLVMWAAVLVNAVLQAVLVWTDPVPEFSIVFLLLAAASFVVFLVAAALVTSAALETVTGRVRFGVALGRARRNAGPFTVWFVLLLVALALGTALYTIPAIVIAFATPFVLLAAMDGHRNALAADLRAIGSRIGRWLLTAVLMAVVVAVSSLLAAVSGYFISGVASAFIVWVWFGFLFCWFQCSWAALFRSTDVGRGPAA